MRLIQKPKVAESIGKISSLLRVDSDIFAELLRREKENYVFAIRFKIRLDNSSKDLKNYSKVRVTVRKVEEEKDRITDVKSAELLASGIETTGLRPNASMQSNKSAVKLLKPNNGVPMQKLPSKLQGKLYSGLQILKDLEKKESFVDQKDVSVDLAVQEAIQNTYTFTELYEPIFKQDLKINRSIFENQQKRPRTNLAFEKNLSLKVFDSDDLDPTDLIERINLELIDPTSPVKDEMISKLSNQSYLAGPNMKKMKVERGESSLYFDMTKYYMDKIPDHPREESIVRYEKRITTKTQDSVEFDTEVTIPYYLRLNTLEVRFDLYETETNNIEETVFTDLPVASHVEAFETPKVCPDVRVSQKALPPRSKSTNATYQYDVSVFDPSPLPDSLIAGHNIYLKTISKMGRVSSYRKVGFLPLNTKSMSVTSTSKLSVIRAVPVGRSNKESNVFTNAIAGPGHEVIGNLTIIPSHFGRNNYIKIEIANVPRSTTSVAIYKRDCTDNPDGKFKLYNVIRGTKGVSASVIDKDADVGRIYEYYAVATLSRKEKEVPIVSNFAMLKNVPSIVNNKSMTVTLSNPSTAQTGGRHEVTFQLKTVISKTENERITETLKNQLGELYSQFLDPQSNSSSPLGDSRGVPEYSDLILHEIVRTNLNTGERETFDLVADGLFTDGAATQKNSNVKSINPVFSYSYHVYTYKKNPIELFKKYIAKGTDRKGKEWFYLPFKWLNSKAKSGRLYPDDSNGIPVIDAYESFTSESYGLTAFYTITGSTQFTSISNVVANRLDRNTVVVSWSFKGESDINKINLYDSFVVMKVVNGIRNFVGRTSKQFIYHDIDESDIGSLYYIVVPIMAEFDINDPGYSNVMVIYPEGLTQRLKKFTTASSTQFKNLIGDASEDLSNTRTVDMNASNEMNDAYVDYAKDLEV